MVHPREARTGLLSPELPGDCVGKEEKQEEKGMGGDTSATPPISWPSSSPRGTLAHERGRGLRFL